jgi:hypothetical protein
MSRGATLRAALAATVVVAGSVLAPPGAALPSGARPAEANHTAIEGFGAVTTGGAGQPPCVVRSLGDSGPGTLRACVSSGRRYVTFVVAGTIALESQLEVHGPFVTIDGFSAPAPGITLLGWGLNIWDTVPDTHDIVVRGLRIRDVGRPSGRKSSTDCVGLNGPGVFNIVLDHLSIANCADGGIDISSGPKNVTIQWSVISTGKALLWGSTSSSDRKDTDRISMHHTMVICGTDALGCDRFPLVRASGYAVRADVRRNVFGRWLRASGTNIEPAAWVNVIGNAYLPHPESLFSHRQESLAVHPGARVYTEGNVELGRPPRPDLNKNGNETRPMPAPPITEHQLGCVLRDAGMHPRDPVDRTLVALAAAAPSDCDEPPPSWRPRDAASAGGDP